MPQPANDNWANAIAIGGTSGEITGTNVGATDEDGSNEPANNGATVWWAWTCPQNGAYYFSTEGNGIGQITGAPSTNFNSILQAFALFGPPANYSVATLNELVPYIHDQSGGIGTTPGRNVTSKLTAFGYEYGARIAFQASAGVTYYIRVDTRDGSTGSIYLKWNLYYPERLGACNECVDFSAAQCLGSATYPASIYQITTAITNGALQPITTPDLQYLLNILNGLETPQEITFNLPACPVAPGLYQVVYCGGAIVNISCTYGPSAGITINIGVVYSPAGIILTPPVSYSPSGGLAGGYVNVTQGSSSIGWFLNGSGVQDKVSQSSGFLSESAAESANFCAVTPPFISNGATLSLDCGPNFIRIPNGSATTAFCMLPMGDAPTFKLVYTPMFPSLSFYLKNVINGNGTNGVVAGITQVEFGVSGNSSSLTWPNVSLRLVAGPSGLSGIGGPAQGTLFNVPPGSPQTQSPDKFTFNTPSVSPYQLVFNVYISGILAGTMTYTMQPLIALTYAPFTPTAAEGIVRFFNEYFGNFGNCPSGNNLTFTVSSNNPNVLFQVVPSSTPQTSLTFNCGGPFGLGSIVGELPNFFCNALNGSTPVTFTLQFSDSTGNYPPYVVTAII